MLRDIVHYDNRINSAQARWTKDNKVLLKLEVQAKRSRNAVGSSQAELTAWTRPLPLLIQYNSNPSSEASRTEQVEALKVHNGINHIELTLDAMPSKVRLDPKMLLLDISLKDQARKLQPRK